MKNIIKDLKWRNLLFNKIKNIKNILNENKKIVYIGFDITYFSLHIGHLLAISILNRLYNYGYKIIIIIGQTTTLINNNEKINLNYNKLKIINQLKKLFNNKKILILNNYNWLKKLNFIKIINLFFKKILLNKLIKKKIKKKNNNNTLYLSEFIYPFLQGYDYYYLNKKYNCNLQIGGSDQWGNILIGIDIIKKNKNKKNIYGFTYPLLLNNKGKKFSKSNKNIKNIWLNKKLTSIFRFYQYFLNLNDKDSILYIKYFSFQNYKYINNIIIKHNLNKNLKILQKKIAKILTIWVHGYKNYKYVKKISKILFKKNYNKLNKKLINFLKKQIKNKKIIINNYLLNINNLIKNKFLFKSKNNYKKFIINNGLLLFNNKKIIINNNIININKYNLIKNKYLIIQKGKKNFFLLKIKNINYKNNE
ncbi:MAG: tyrosine--tRNA ligase [Candidatus Shikimatogenerans sp. JK-2022]|nr:tyrosine--tRNA ligase [Candidatus Shikimatogenerans bostrichidophilus]